MSEQAPEQTRDEVVEFTDTMSDEPLDRAAAPIRGCCPIFCQPCRVEGDDL